ncbi:MAG: hypothetical protein ACRDPY_43075 [Streptosporangiaceae bacterium]
MMASVEHALSSVARPGLLGRLWRWRYEGGLLCGLAAVALASGYILGAVWLIAIVATGLGLLAAGLSWPASRQRLIARAWTTASGTRVNGTRVSRQTSLAGLRRLSSPLGRRRLRWLG